MGEGSKPTLGEITQGFIAELDAQALKRLREARPLLDMMTRNAKMTNDADPIALQRAALEQWGGEIPDPLVEAGHDPSVGYGEKALSDLMPERERQADDAESRQRSREAWARYASDFLPRGWSFDAAEWLLIRNRGGAYVTASDDSHEWPSQIAALEASGRGIYRRESDMSEDTKLFPTHRLCGCAKTDHAPGNCPNLTEGENLAQRARMASYVGIYSAHPLLEKLLDKAKGKEVGTMVTARMPENKYERLARWFGDQGHKKVPHRLTSDPDVVHLEESIAGITPGLVAVDTLLRALSPSDPWGDTFHSTGSGALIPQPAPVKDDSDVGVSRAAEETGRASEPPQGGCVVVEDTAGHWHSITRAQAIKVADLVSKAMPKWIADDPYAPKDFDLWREYKLVCEMKSELEDDNVRLRARIAKLDTELAKQPAAFVDPEPDPLEHNPFRAFNRDPRRIGR